MKSFLSALAIAAAAAVAVPALQAQAPPSIAFSPFNVEFMSEPMPVDTEPVTGAPYSAEAVNEIVQTLADGNRIVRRRTSQISRDSNGRTRREQNLAMFGPIIGGASHNGPRHVQIFDPSTQTTIMLDLEAQIAHRMTAPNVKIISNAGGMNVAPGGPNVALDHFQMAVPAPPPGSPQAGVRVFSARKVELSSAVENAASVEQLGAQFMEGLTVEGTRTSMTIPAGQIGNEQPITIVSERWFSPELKVLVMSRQSDPRFGETTYRLTNVNRAEPPAELFEIPAGFQVVDPASNRDVIFERKVINR